MKIKLTILSLALVLIVVGAVATYYRSRMRAVEKQVATLNNNLSKSQKEITDLKQTAATQQVETTTPEAPEPSAETPVCLRTSDFAPAITGETASWATYCDVGRITSKNYSYRLPPGYSVEKTSALSFANSEIVNDKKVKILGFDIRAIGLEGGDYSVQDDKKQFGPYAAEIKTFSESGVQKYKFINFDNGLQGANFNGIGAEQYISDSDTDAVVAKIISTFRFKK